MEKSSAPFSLELNQFEKYLDQRYIMPLFKRPSNNGSSMYKKYHYWFILKKE